MTFMLQGKNLSSNMSEKSKFRFLLEAGGVFDITSVLVSDYPRTLT